MTRLDTVLKLVAAMLLSLVMITAGMMEDWPVVSLALAVIVLEVSRPRRSSQ